MTRATEGDSEVSVTRSSHVWIVVRVAGHARVVVVAIQIPDNGWSAFEIKLDPGQVDEAALSLARIASKFKHDPPTSLGAIVGKSGIAYCRKEDGVYVVPIMALRA